MLLNFLVLLILIVSGIGGGDVLLTLLFLVCLLIVVGSIGGGDVLLILLIMLPLLHRCQIASLSLPIYFIPPPSHLGTLSSHRLHRS